MNCKNCGRHLGYIVSGDVYCKCGHYNIIDQGKETKLVVKSLYSPKTSMATVQGSQ